MNRLLLVLFLIFTSFFAFSQSEEYQKKKAEKLAKPSPFEAIVNEDPNRELIYQDEFVAAFVPLRRQAPIHFLIVPKRRINSINDIDEEDAETMAHLLFAAKEIAMQYGVAETGYRLVINTNEDAGQSVFHIHMHLLGGKPLGPITTQDYTEPEGE